MKEFKMLDLNDLNAYEKKHNRVSYARIIKEYAPNILLCNEIVNIDPSVLDNMCSNYYDEETDEYKDIYQYFLCSLNEWDREHLEEYGVILSYSDALDLDVICVDHFGTGWDYVLTNNVPILHE